MKKVLFTICLCTCLLLTGCGEKDNGSKVESAKTSKNSVVCTTTSKLNYRDIEILKRRIGKLDESENTQDFLEKYEENQKKLAIDAGGKVTEDILEFNSDGTKIEKIYSISTSEFTHEEVTDDLLKEYKDYLDEYYTNYNKYTDHKITLDGKKLIEELTYNMNEIDENLNITKQEVINLYSKSGANYTTICKEN